jgi:hypothetical protein
MSPATLSTIWQRIQILVLRPMDQTLKQPDAAKGLHAPSSRSFNYSPMHALTISSRRYDS